MLSSGLRSPVSLGCVALVAVLLCPVAAGAQTIEFARSYPDRSVKLRAGGLQPYWISKADCLADDVFTFQVTTKNSSGYQLEVWASSTGADCKDYGNRVTVLSPPPCYPVYYAAATVGTRAIPIRDQDLVDQVRVDPTQANAHGTAASCEKTSTTGSAVALSIQFILTDSSGQGQASIKYDTKFDLFGPPPPDGVKAGIAEDSLVVGWNASQSTDVYGYSVYCAPSEVRTGTGGSTATEGTAATGGVSEAVGTGGASATGGGETQTAGAAGAETGGSAAAETGGTAETVGGESSTAGTGATTASSSCVALSQGSEATPLTAGQVPPAGHGTCGTVAGQLQSQATASGLQNGSPYAVGVAAYDLVGNVGPLSTLVCQTPAQVDDFYDLYRQAGGRAGGGFCATGPRRTPWGAAMVAGACLAYALRRRRQGR